MELALHDNIALCDGDVSAIITGTAEQATGVAPLVVRFSTPIDLIDKISRSEHALLDLIIVPYSLPGMTGIDAIREARELIPNLRSMLFADDGSRAPEAALNLVDEFLIDPVSATSFEKAYVRQLKRIAAHHEESVTIQARGGAKRIACKNLLYCETSGHDQLIHLIDGTVVSARYSSQALFDLLSSDPRFFKAGSSYIVNLHEVIEARTSKGTILLSNDMELNVPARLRKGLEEALLSLA